MQIIVATMCILLLDGIWLGFLAKNLYIREIGKLMTIKGGAIVPYWPAAVVVYVALVAGILLFVIPKAQNQLLPALFWGGMFGLVTYATYDFTNLAVLSNWSLKLSLIDTAWGSVLCGLTSMITVAVYNYFK